MLSSTVLMGLLSVLAAPAAESAPRGSHLAIVYSAGLRAEYEPCG